jgi:hypothetical protein
MAIQNHKRESRERATRTLKFGNKKPNSPFQGHNNKKCE